MFEVLLIMRISRFVAAYRLLLLIQSEALMRVYVLTNEMGPPWARVGHFYVSYRDLNTRIEPGCQSNL